MSSSFLHTSRHRLPTGRGHARVRTVGLAGRDAVVRVTDADVPAPLRRDGWWTHAARMTHDGTIGSGTPPDLAVPNDPSLARAGARRIAAYLAGRYCAARALAAAGVTAARVTAALPVGEAGAPLWPRGFVGSISHAPARAVAVVARAERWRALGVDCEPVLATAQADEIAELTLPEADDAELATDAGAGDPLTWPEFVTIGFSAKETLYKALRPLVGLFFDFPDAHLTHLDRAARCVRLVLARDLAPGFARGAAFDVRFALADAHVHTCLALPHLPEPDAGGPTAPECAP